MIKIMYLFVYSTIIIIVITTVHFFLFHGRLASSKNILGLTDKACLIDSSAKNFLSIRLILLLLLLLLLLCIVFVKCSIF